MSNIIIKFSQLKSGHNIKLTDGPHKEIKEIFKYNDYAKIVSTDGFELNVEYSVLFCLRRQSKPCIYGIFKSDYRYFVFHLDGSVEYFKDIEKASCYAQEFGLDYMELCPRRPGT